MRNCGRLLISQGSCYPTDLCKVFGDQVMCITIKMLCLVKMKYGLFSFFSFYTGDFTTRSHNFICWVIHRSMCYTTLFHKASHYGTYICTDMTSTDGFELMDARVFTCLTRMFFKFQSHVHFYVSARLRRLICAQPPPGATVALL